MNWVERGLPDCDWEVPVGGWGAHVAVLVHLLYRLGAVAEPLDGEGDLWDEQGLGGEEAGVGGWVEARGVGADWGEEEVWDIRDDGEEGSVVDLKVLLCPLLCVLWDEGCADVGRVHVEVVDGAREASYDAEEPLLGYVDRGGLRGGGQGVMAVD